MPDHQVKPGPQISPKLKRQDSMPYAMMGAGLEMVGTIIVLALGGWWLDNRWGTRPWLMIAGLAIGFFSSIYKLWRFGKRFF